MIGEALVFIALAAFMAAVAWHSAKTGSLSHARMPGMGSGETTREKYPVVFWLGNTPWIGGAALFVVLALLCITDTFGVTEVYRGVVMND